MESRSAPMNEAVSVQPTMSARDIAASIRSRPDGQDLKDQAANTDHSSKEDLSKKKGSTMLETRHDVVTRVVLRDKTPCLVATFQNSTMPVVWHIPLNGLARTSMSLRGDQGGWTLCLRDENAIQGTQNMEVHFLGRGDADAAFEAMRRAMMRSDLFIGGRSIMRWIMLGIVVMGIIGFFLLPAKEPAKPTPIAVDAAATAQKQSNAAPTTPNQAKARSKEELLRDYQNSMPVTADDILPNVED